MPATLLIDGMKLDSVGVRCRGNTSLMTIGNAEKKSFNIELDWIKKQNLYGYTTLNLNNGFEDPTFMREVLYANACSAVCPCPKANFVKLLINGENWGIYINVQQLDGTFFKEWGLGKGGARWRAGTDRPGPGGPPPGALPADSAFFNNPPPDGMPPNGPPFDGPPPDSAFGNGPPPEGMLPHGMPVDDPPDDRLPHNGPFSGNPGAGERSTIGGGVTRGEAALTWLGTDESKYQAVYTLKSDKKKALWSRLIRVCDVLNNTELANLPAELEKVLDVDVALWMCAFEIVFEDDDGYVHKRGADYYLYFSDESNRLVTVQYDGNACMIVADHHRPWPAFYRATDPLAPLMSRLLAVPAYRQRYLAHVRTILNQYMTETYLWPRIDSLRALIEAEVKADTKKLDSNEAFDRGVAALKKYVTDRRAFLLADAEVKCPAPKILALSQPLMPSGDDSVLTVTAQLAASGLQQVNLYMQEGRSGAFQAQPMYDDSRHGDLAAGDNIYGAQIRTRSVAGSMKYYIQAVADDAVASMTFAPTAEHLCPEYVLPGNKPATTVILNEIMAQNKTTLADAQGSFDDWIELYNTLDKPIDLSTLYLSDDIQKPLKWKFPSRTLIPAHGYLIVWADEDAQDRPGLHANFKLSASGEEVLLSHADGLLDSVSFGSQSADVAYGRKEVGSGIWAPCLQPTPGQPNQPSDAFLKKGKIK